MKIGIIGIGNMGSAIAKGLLGKNELFCLIEVKFRIF